MNDDSEIKGLGGWLILVGIGVIIAPIRLLVMNIPNYVHIFKNGTWEALTTVGSESYRPFWEPLLIGELTYISIMAALSIYLIYLFFSKHYLFPKLYIILAALSIIFIILDTWLANIVLPNKPMFDPETTREFVRILITALIWVPYILFSRRVKATFVEKMPNKQIHPAAESFDRYERYEDKKIKYGKWFVLASALLCCSLSAIVIFMYLYRMELSIENILPRIIRFLLTVGIFILIYRGQNWARWLMTFFSGIVVILIFNNINNAMMLIMLLVYVTTIILLVSPHVSAYLKYAKENTDPDVSTI